MNIFRDRINLTVNEPINNLAFFIESKDPVLTGKYLIVKIDDSSYNPSSEPHILNINKRELYCIDKVVKLTKKQVQIIKHLITTTSPVSKESLAIHINPDYNVKCQVISNEGIIFRLNKLIGYKFISYTHKSYHISHNCKIE